MPFFRYIPIKRKILFSYVLLLVVPLLLISIFIYLETSQMIENKSVKQFQTVSQYANQQIDQYVADIENLSVNILENPQLQSALNQPYKAPKDWTTQDIETENEIRSFLNGIYKLKPGISSILIYGYNGSRYFYHPIRRWDDFYDGSKEEWYTETVKLDGRWTISGKREEKQLFSTLDPAPERVVTFSRIIKDLDTFLPIAVMSVNVKLEMIESLAGLHHLTDEMIILDRGGQPLAASLGAEGKEDRSDWLQAGSVSDYTGWKSVYLISKSELFKESREIRNYIIVLAGVLFLLALVLANALSSGIVKPVLKLKLKMKEVERGEFTSLEDTTVSRDEVGELTVGFNRMVERVKQLVNEIRDREKVRLQTELNAMQARINPHFMYNTLNGIRWVAMMDGNKKVTEMITSLVTLLQFSAKNTDPLIPVEKELQMLTHYAALMKMRNDQFDFVLEADETVRDCAIIPFLLQPIVENAIFHGMIPKKERGLILVRLAVANGYVEAEVADNGVGMEEEAAADLLNVKTNKGGELNKIGVANVYERLKLQFSESASMEVSSKPLRGTVIRIRWPMIPAKELPT